MHADIKAVKSSSYPTYIYISRQEGGNISLDVTDIDILAQPL